VCATHLLSHAARVFLLLLAPLFRFFSALRVDDEWDSGDEDDDEEEDANEEEEERKEESSGNVRGQRGGKNTKIKKQRGGKNDNDDDGPSKVLYIGHLPVEFEESELWTFLKQFGRVKHVRVSRSQKQTGRSRGFAFVEMHSPSVANIVAETLSGYIMFGQKRLVCHVVPPSKVHRKLFFPITKKDRKQQRKARDEKRKRREQSKPLDKLKVVTDRLVERERKKREKLKLLGIEYDFPGYEEGMVREVGAGTTAVAKGSSKSTTFSKHDDDDIVNDAEEEEEAVEQHDNSKKTKKKRKDSTSGSLDEDFNDSDEKRRRKRKNSVSSSVDGGSEREEEKEKKKKTPTTKATAEATKKTAASTDKKKKKKKAAKGGKSRSTI